MYWTPLPFLKTWIRPWYLSTWQKLNDGDISDRHTRGLLTHTCWMGIDVVHHLYSFNVFCSDDLQLLQQPIDAWQLLKRLPYQSTVGKEANAPGLSQTCQPLSILYMSGVDRYDSDCFSPFFNFLCEFCINLVFFQITSQSVYSATVIFIHLNYNSLTSVIILRCCVLRYLKRL